MPLNGEFEVIVYPVPSPILSTIATKVSLTVPATGIKVIEPVILEVTVEFESNVPDVVTGALPE